MDKKYHQIFYFVLLACISTQAISKIYIKPYLQNISKNGATVMWVTESEHKSFFNWGTNKNLKFRMRSQVKPFKTPHYSNFDKRIHQVKITGLKPGMEYFFRVEHQKQLLDTQSFKTSPAKHKNFSFLIMSDAQNGHKTTSYIVKEGIVPTVIDNYENAEKYPLSLGLFTGDLVHRGLQFFRWDKEWFGPLAPILKYVPIFPVIGNHEDNTAYYFDFFDLPKNGTPGKEEHWYYHDFSNIRFIALDSNKKYHSKEQLKWLKNVLKLTRTNKSIDFVVAQFHHPGLSELWNSGSTEYSRKIINILIDFSKQTKIPTISIAGHTHGYSRGFDINDPHTLLVVGSLGGKLDRWRWGSTDFLEYIKTFSQFGWMLAEVETGKDPKIRFKRYGYNKKFWGPYIHHGVVDEFVVKRYSKIPEKPIALYPRDNQKIIRSWGISTFEASDFFDEDQDGHLTSHLQISKTSDFVTIEGEKILNNENWFYGEDINKGMSLTKFQLKTLRLRLRRGVYYWRIRYRDKALAWSDWSDPALFSI